MVFGFEKPETTWSVILNNECVFFILFTGTWKSEFFIKKFLIWNKNLQKFRHAIFSVLLGSSRSTIMFEVFLFVRRLVSE